MRMGRVVVVAALLSPPSVLKQATTFSAPALTSVPISSHFPPAVAHAAASLTFSIIPPVYSFSFSCSQAWPSEPRVPTHSWASSDHFPACSLAWEASPDTQSVKLASEAEVAARRRTARKRRERGEAMLLLC